MDNAREFGGDRLGLDALDGSPGNDAAGGVAEVQIDVGADERRMHVRAYNHWVSLLGGRAYPAIVDLDPANIADFGPHSVLLDFSRGLENPAIAYLGTALRAECDLDSSVTHIAQVPGRSLLSRLTDHYLQIIANRSPVGFEAEFVGTRGHTTMYRGILMPFSSDDESIDFIYGVINWKELVDADTQARLQAEIAAGLSAAPKTAPCAAVWADGPSAGLEQPDTPEDDFPAPASTGLTDQLMLAQQTAAAVRAADTSRRAALYRALGQAHDFAAAADANPVEYEALLESAGIAVQLRDPMTPVVQLVFGASYDETRLTEYAAVLAHARRVGVATGGLGDFLDRFDGGIEGVVRAERTARAPAAGARSSADATLDSWPAIASVVLKTECAHGDYVVLLARAGADGVLDIVAAIADDSALTEQAMKRAR